MAKPTRTRAEARLAVLDAQRKVLQTASDITKINDFIISLCEDPRNAAAFKQDPDAALTAAGIPAPLREVIKAANQYGLGHIASGGVVEGSETVVVIVIVVVIVAAVDPDVATADSTREPLR